MKISSRDKVASLYGIIQRAIGGYARLLVEVRASRYKFFAVMTPLRSRGNCAARPTFRQLPRFSWWWIHFATLNAHGDTLDTIAGRYQLNAPGCAVITYPFLKYKCTVASKNSSSHSENPRNRQSLYDRTRTRRHTVDLRDSLFDFSDALPRVRLLEECALLIFH